MKLKQYIFKRPVEFDRLVIPGVLVGRDGVIDIDLDAGLLTVSRQDGVWFVLDSNGVGVPASPETQLAGAVVPAMGVGGAYITSDEYKAAMNASTWPEGKKQRSKRQ